MCDWPGVHEATCCCPFAESKVCDIISMWSTSLEELNYSTASHVQPKQQRREIMFTYQRRYDCVLKMMTEKATEREALRMETYFFLKC